MQAEATLSSTCADTPSRKASACGPRGSPHRRAAEGWRSARPAPPTSARPLWRGTCGTRRPPCPPASGRKRRAQRVQPLPVLLAVALGAGERHAPLVGVLVARRAVLVEPDVAVLRLLDDQRVGVLVAARALLLEVLPSIVQPMSAWSKASGSGTPASRKLCKVDDGEARAVVLAVAEAALLDLRARQDAVQALLDPDLRLRSSRGSRGTRRSSRRDQPPWQAAQSARLDLGDAACTSVTGPGDVRLPSTTAKSSTASVETPPIQTCGLPRFSGRLRRARRTPGRRTRARRRARP
jgi:hypothetical protein